MGDGAVSVDEEFLRESNAIESVYAAEALDQALEAWEYLQEADELTHEVVKEVHNRLLSKRQPDIAGKYRSQQVVIGGDYPPSPAEVSPLMSNLLGREPSTALEAIQWHVDFEKIHPFTDGNGRVGRLLYLWHCRCLLDATPVIWREEDKQGYYALFSTAPSPDIH